MCGIAGILSFHNQKVRFENIELMTQHMRHRGPDDEGLVFFSQDGTATLYGGKDTPGSIYRRKLPYLPARPFNGNYPDNTILALGHRRLSIIDLSDAGHQPMCTEDGRYWITYNGEIYNYRELRPELEKEGDVFVSNSDTEIILKAYRRWGHNCLKRFNGMWAFAIWDNIERQLFCSRDRIGIKPFYYYRTNDYFLFASDIKTLIASTLYQAEINYEGLWHNLSFSIAPRPMTCFKDVFALEQSHWMTLDARNGITRKERFWDIPIGTQDQTMTEPEAIELLEYELSKAIKYQLVADVDVGTSMSGGVDSTTVASIASSLHPGIKAFTLGFDAPEFDELEQAVATAKMHPLQHVIQIVQPRDILEDIPNMIRCAEEPTFLLSSTYVISKLVSENDVKVVMNGLGGDELFAGYSHYAFVNKWMLLNRLRYLIALLPSGIHPRIDKGKRLSSSNIGQFYASCHSTVSEYDKACLFGEAHRYHSLDVLDDLYNANKRNFPDNVEALSYFDILHYIGNHQVYRTDQFAMFFSVEGRFPFLDHNLIEAAFRIPTKHKLRNRLQKYVLRKVAEKYIHPSCLTMKKKGFGLPSGRWFEKDLKSIADDSLQYLGNAGIFKSSADYMNIVSKNRQKYILLALWHQVFFGEP